MCNLIGMFFAIERPDFRRFDSPFTVLSEEVCDAFDHAAAFWFRYRPKEQNTLFLGGHQSTTLRPSASADSRRFVPPRHRPESQPVLICPGLSDPRQRKKTLLRITDIQSCMDKRQEWVDFRLSISVSRNDELLAVNRAVQRSHQCENICQSMCPHQL